MKLQIRFIPFIALALLALLVALWAGLARIGWLIPSFPNLSVAHGPLMVSGFSSNAFAAAATIPT